MNGRRRLTLLYAAFGVVVLAVTTGAVLAVLPGMEKIPEKGLVPGIIDSYSAQIPSKAPALRFTRMPLDFRHFGGAKRTRRLPEDMGSGVAMEDFDGDGLPDLFLVNAGPLGAPPPPCALFRNRGDFRFERVDIPLPALHGMGAAAADYDADGDFDLYVTGYGRNVLLRNDGGFRFTDVTDEAGVAGGGFSAGACWGDADGDGDLDLYVTRYVAFDEASAPEESVRGNLSLPATLNPSVYPAEANLLYLHEEGGRFREAAAEWGVANPAGKGLGAVFADFDADGAIDLYVANDVTDNVFFRGCRGQPFEDRSHATCTADWRGAMGLAVGDPDGDGDLDLFITHWKPEENALYVQEPGPLFKDDSLRTALGPPGRGRVGWATEFVDLDNDGLPDLYVVNGDTFERPDARDELGPMYAQLFWNGGSRFFDLASRAGPALQEPFVGRGGGAADLDGDGDLDLLFVAHGAAPLLLRNDTQKTGNHLFVEARGSAPNLFAFGATVEVHAAGRRHVQVVGAKASYLSSGPQVLHFGLGAVTQADRVVVRYAGGATVEKTRVAAGTRLVVKEVDARALGARMDLARDTLAEGRNAEAIGVLREVVRLDPTHPGALYLLAQLVDPVEGLALCLRLLAVEPMTPRGHLLRARFLSDPQRPDLLDLDTAMEEVARARALNRDETGGLAEEARIHLLKGDLRLAAATFARVRANPRAAAMAALCHFRLGERAAALRLLGLHDEAEGPGDIPEEGDTAERKMGDRDPVARLLLLGRSERWNLVRLPVESEAAPCGFKDLDGDGHQDALVGTTAVLLQGTRVLGSRPQPTENPEGTPSLRPSYSAYAFEDAVRWALAPPERCDGPPPGTTAALEADVDGDGDLDLVCACGGDDPAAALPWWVLLREADGGFRPLRGGIPEPGFRVGALAAADLDGDGRAEILLVGGGWLPHDKGPVYIASLR